MHVLVDAMSPRLGGGLSYITHQLSSLQLVRPDIDLTILVAPWNKEEIRNSTAGDIIEVKVGSVPERFLYEQTLMPLIARKMDLLYCPGNFCPLMRSVPIVLTLQNIHYFGRARHLPQNQTYRRRIEALLCRLSMRRADRLIVVSHAFLEEVRRDGLPVEKCYVIPSGTPSFPEKSTPPRGIDPSTTFILAIANDAPHKRLDDLVLAWSYAGRSLSLGRRLVIAGRMSAARMKAQLLLVPEALRRDLVHLGPVSDRAALKWLLERAAAMVTTSELETFGLTILEAASVGCPVVASDIPVHREVAGHHASFFPPGDTQALSRLLLSVNTAQEREVVWGREFTWERNAARIARVFEETLSRGQPLP